MLFYKAERIMAAGHQDPVNAYTGLLLWRQSVCDMNGPQNGFTESFTQNLQAPQSCPQPSTAWQRIPVLLPSRFAQTQE